MARISKETKAAKTLATVMGVFIICWLPFFVTNIVAGICPGCISNPELTFAVLTWLGWINSSMNPVIYACCSTEFRRAFAKLLCLCCPGRCLSRLWTKWKRRLEEEKKLGSPRRASWATSNPVKDNDRTHLTSHVASPLHNPRPKTPTTSTTLSPSSTSNSTTNSPVPPPPPPVQNGSLKAEKVKVKEVKNGDLKPQNGAHQGTNPRQNGGHTIGNGYVRQGILTNGFAKAPNPNARLLSLPGSSKSSAERYAVSYRSFDSHNSEEVELAFSVLVEEASMGLMLEERAESEQSGRVLGGRGGSFFPVRVARNNSFYAIPPPDYRVGSGEKLL